MVVDEKDEAHIARPSGLPAALQNAAQLPFSVAAGLADEVVFQTESIGPARRDTNVDSRQLYHESNSDMRRNDRDRAQKAKGSKEDTGPQDADKSSSHPSGIGTDTATAAAAAASVDASKVEFDDRKPTEHTLSPKKSVSIQDTVDVIGGSTADLKPPKSHLVAARGTDSDDSTSTSSSVSLHLLHRSFGVF